MCYLDGDDVYGEDVYVDDYYMGEVWLPAVNIDDYFVSSRGRLWSNITKRFVYGTQNVRTGHVDVSLRVGGIRVHRYLHRLVAEAFIPRPFGCNVVRHLDGDPTNNCVENLAWGSQRDNVHDSIRDGTFRYFTDLDRERAMAKRRTPVVAIGFQNGEQLYFESQQEASRVLGVSQSDINSVLYGRRYGSKGYYFAHPDDLSGFERARMSYSAKLREIVAIDNITGERHIFKGLTEAGNVLGISTSAISMILHGKMQSARGWSFKYLEECEDV